MMGILYGWKKEYLLEKMSFAQIVMYLNEGMKFKNPSPGGGGQTSGTESGGSLVGASAEQIRANRQKLRDQYATKFGDIEGGET